MSNRIPAYLLILLSVSLFTYAVSLIWQRNKPVNFNFPAKSESTNGQPVYPNALSIDSIGVVLPVKTANITNGKWEDTRGSVAYWKDSVLPGSKGNSVFYGHNWSNVFGKLTRVRKGDLVQIGLSDGSIKKFIVDSTYTVSADETHILNPAEDTRVTIYSCTGFLDSKRFVVIAVPS